ncbi:MAG: helix-turn-helix domain-containing protein [bacterium]
MEINTYLENLGLSDKEIKIYLALLELGESSIVSIRQKVKLPRTTVFHLLGKLKERGLIEITETSTRSIYIPYPPRKLVSILNSQANKLKEQADNLRDRLPELNQLFGSASFMPKVRFFVGEDIREVYEEVLESPIDELLFVGETDKVADILGQRFFKNWVNRKVEKKIWTKSIRVSGSEDPFFDPKEGLRKARFTPESFKSPAHIYIYHNSVAIITTSKENFAVVITSREYAETMKHWFTELWKVSTTIK